MKDRISEEIELLTARFPTLQYSEAGHWVLLPAYQCADGLWSTAHADACFQIPPAYPGQKPYGFYVRLPFALATGGEINNVTSSLEPPFGGEWLKFSWDLPDWAPGPTARDGSNLLNWALSFRKRLEEGA